MEEDILNYSPTVMFHGTPCMLPDKFAYYILVLKIKTRWATRSQRPAINVSFCLVQCVVFREFVSLQLCRISVLMYLCVCVSYAVFTFMRHDIMLTLFVINSCERSDSLWLFAWRCDNYDSFLNLSNTQPLLYLFILATSTSSNSRGFNSSLIQARLHFRSQFDQVNIHFSPLLLYPFFLSAYTLSMENYKIQFREVKDCWKIKTRLI